MPDLVGRTLTQEDYDDRIDVLGLKYQYEETIAGVANPQSKEEFVEEKLVEMQESAYQEEVYKTRQSQAIAAAMAAHIAAEG
jgi:hypothetical protein